MKVGFKKKSVLLAAFLGIVFQIVSLQSAQAMHYEAVMDARIYGRTPETDPLYSTEEPFSWSCCFDCFSWHHNEERTDNLPTQDTKNTFKDKIMALSDWASFSYYYSPYYEMGEALTKC